MTWHYKASGIRFSSAPHFRKTPAPPTANRLSPGRQSGEWWTVKLSAVYTTSCRESTCNEPCRLAPMACCDWPGNPLTWQLSDPERIAAIAPSAESRNVAGAVIGRRFRARASPGGLWHAPGHAEGQG